MTEEELWSNFGQETAGQNQTFVDPGRLFSLVVPEENVWIPRDQTIHWGKRPNVQYPTLTFNLHQKNLAVQDIPRGSKLCARLCSCEWFWKDLSDKERTNSERDSPDDTVERMDPNTMNCLGEEKSIVPFEKGFAVFRHLRVSKEIKLKLAETIYIHSLGFEIGFSSPYALNSFHPLTSSTGGSVIVKNNVKIHIVANKKSFKVLEKRVGAAVKNEPITMPVSIPNTPNSGSVTGGPVAISKSKSFQDFIHSSGSSINVNTAISSSTSQSAQSSPIVFNHERRGSVTGNVPATFAPAVLNNTIVTSNTIMNFPSQQISNLMGAMGYPVSAQAASVPYSESQQDSLNDLNSVQPNVWIHPPMVSSVQESNDRMTLLNDPSSYLIAKTGNSAKRGSVDDKDYYNANNIIETTFGSSKDMPLLPNKRARISSGAITASQQNINPQSTALLSPFMNGNLSRGDRSYDMSYLVSQNELLAELESMQKWIDSYRYKISNYFRTSVNMPLLPVNSPMNQLLKSENVYMNDNKIIIRKNLMEENPLHLIFCAMRCQNLEFVVALAKTVNYDLNQPNEICNTLLHCAAVHGFADGVRWLLQSGVNVNSRNRRGMTALHLAHMKNDAQIKDILGKFNADPEVQDRDGMRPTDMATLRRPLVRYSKDNVAMVELHIEGAINAIFPIQIWCAVRFGWLDVVRAYIECFHYDVDARNTSGATPLIIACHYQKEDVARYLLSMGADPNARDIYDRTPLHFAYMHGSFNIVPVLEVQYDADKNITDVWSRTPASYGHRRPPVQKL